MTTEQAPWPTIVSLINHALDLTDDSSDAARLRALLINAREEALEQCIQSHRSRVTH